MGFLRIVGHDFLFGCIINTIKKNKNTNTKTTKTQTLNHEYVQQIFRRFQHFFGTGW
jgi:hypothetical protein